ncbi:hypothetical protein BJV77DRAFT_1147474 [Russula vinacea]|nr:hypothetical protein BJV77DRAFT_1147474 [Russula vinacea]
MMSNVTRKFGIPLYGPYERTLLDTDNENWAYAHPQLGTGVFVLFENATWIHPRQAQLLYEPNNSLTGQPACWRAERIVASSNLRSFVELAPNLVNYFVQSGGLLAVLKEKTRKCFYASCLEHLDTGELLKKPAPRPGMLSTQTLAAITSKVIRLIENTPFIRIIKSEKRLPEY